MPYGKFVRDPKGGVNVFFKSGKLAFHSDSESMAQAHRTAALRELAKQGKLKVAKK